MMVGLLQLNKKGDTMLKKKRMMQVVLLILILMILSITTGCTRKAVTQRETLTGQKASQLEEQAGEASKKRQSAREAEPQRTNPQEAAIRTPASTQQEVTASGPATQSITEEPIKEKTKSHAS